MEIDQQEPGITPEIYEWVVLAFDHVRIGDFEGAIGLIKDQGTRKALDLLAQRIMGDVRTGQMDVSEVLNEIARQASLLNLH